MATVPTKRPSGAGAALRTRVELWIAIMFMVVAFGAGLTVGVLAQPKEQPVVGVTTGGVSQPGTGGIVAPPLSDDQLSQGLPAGHPALTGATGAAGGTGATGSGGGKADKGSQDGSTGSNP